MSLTIITNPSDTPPLWHMLLIVEDRDEAGFSTRPNMHSPATHDAPPVEWVILMFEWDEIEENPRSYEFLSSMYLGDLSDYARRRLEDLLTKPTYVVECQFTVEAWDEDEAGDVFEDGISTHLDYEVARIYDV